MIILAAEAAPAVFEAPPVALHLGVGEVRVVALAVVVAGAEAGLEHAGHSLHQEEGGQRGHQKGPQQRRVAGRHRACMQAQRSSGLDGMGAIERGLAAWVCAVCCEARARIYRLARLLLFF